MKSKFKNCNDRWKRILLTMVLIVIAVICAYPIVWLFMSSLKTNNELFTNPWGFGSVLHWENYDVAWNDGHIGKYFINSIIVTFTSVFFVIFISSMASFSIVRLKWKLSNTVMIFFMIGIMIPIHATLIPLFMMFNKINILNTRLSLILSYVAFALPISIFILSGFFSTIPCELEEAAVLEGADMKKIFWKIILPISKPAVATITIFNFVSIWNELLFATVFISDSKKMTLPVGLTSFAGQYTVNWVPLLAAVAIVSLPSILVYLVLNEKIIKGLAGGAIKG